VTDRPESARAAPPAGSFDDFVRVTARTMHRTALLLTGGDHHLAEDLTQATFTKVYVAWRRISRTDDPVAYTRQVLTRTYLSHRRLRRSAERPTSAVPDAASQGRDDGARLDLLAALGRLSVDDRAVVVLRYTHDLSVARTADVLHLSEAAVRQRSRRALARLRTLVPDLEPDLPLDATEQP
jgi:RNA polymerase sigma-70 factor (sigma-E family)